MARFIKEATEDLPEEELRALRALYRKRLAALEDVGRMGKRALRPSSRSRIPGA